MKKTILLAFTALTIFSANAQEVISTGTDCYFDFVPAILSCNNETIILEGSGNIIKILTGNQAGTTFNAQKSEDYKIYDMDNATSSDDRITFTQNLFNEDEFIEWIYDDLLYSSNGTITQLPFSPKIIYKINRKYYLMGRTDDNKYHLYLIDRKTSSLEAVPADAPEARLVYSLNGHRQNDMQQGINIVTGGENGSRKVLKR